MRTQEPPAAIPPVHAELVLPPVVVGPRSPTLAPPGPHSAPTQSPHPDRPAGTHAAPRQSPSGRPAWQDLPPNWGEDEQTAAAIVKGGPAWPALPQKRGEDDQTAVASATGRPAWQDFPQKWGEDDRSPVPNVETVSPVKRLRGCLIGAANVAAAISVLTIWVAFDGKGSPAPAGLDPEINLLRYLSTSYDGAVLDGYGYPRERIVADEGVGRAAPQPTRELRRRRS
jgi:hypothetical protein